MKKFLRAMNVLMYRLVSAPAILVIGIVFTIAAIVKGVSISELWRGWSEILRKQHDAQMDYIVNG